MAVEVAFKSSDCGKLCRTRKPFAYHHASRPMNTTLRVGQIFATAILVLVFALPIWAIGKQTEPPQEKATDQPAVEVPEVAPDEKVATVKIPRPLDSYKGRQIAQTMHFMGAEWLIRDEREREERCSLMLANLGIRPGQTICDMGCGNGFYTLQIAKMLGPQGSVIGVDVQPEMLGFLRERMEKDGIENVIPILGSYHNPHLPAESIDLILLVDVYHEFSHPVQMLAAMRTSLKPGGRIVLVEYRGEDKTVPIKPLHKMTKRQIEREMSANGFKLDSEFEKLPWQHMMFYGQDETWLPAVSKAAK